MAGGRVFGGSSFTALLQNQRVPCSSEPLDALFLSGSSPPFLGSGPRSMVSFEDVNGGSRLDRSFFRPFDQEDHVDEEYDEYFHQPEKKRRLSADQVQFLEKSFELENKLEPERKVQLAKDLGLQPRQVAIWFQNRRARWKTKQLEKDYDALQAKYNSLKADCGSLNDENEQLKAEVRRLTDELLLKEKERGHSESVANTPLNVVAPENSSPDTSEDEGSKFSNAVCRQEDLCSAKSDVMDSGSPQCNRGGLSSFVEAGDSCNAFEHDQSDISQDEEDELTKTLLPHIFPKIEDVDYTNPNANSCNFGFPFEENQAFWSWSY